MTMNGRPFSSPTSWMVQMCGWLRAEASRASRSKRVSHGAGSWSSLRRNLIATSRSETHILAAIDDAHAALAELLEHAVMGNDRLRHGGRELCLEASESAVYQLPPLVGDGGIG